MAFGQFVWLCLVVLLLVAAFFFVRWCRRRVERDAKAPAKDRRPVKPAHKLVRKPRRKAPAADRA